MKSKSFVLLLTCFFCFFSCKDTKEQVIAEQEKSVSATENSVNATNEETHYDETPAADIKAPDTDKTVHISEKTIVNTEPENEPEQISLPPSVKEEPKVDSRLKFKLGEVSTDELDVKIRGLFDTIEDKIIAEDFEGWYNSLSNNYRSFIDDPDELLKMSKKSGYLSRKKIVLRSSKDYFDYIVIPSRKGVALKYVNFQRIDEKNIKVNCMLDGNMNFGYDFIYENESWKLDKK